MRNTRFIRFSVFIIFAGLSSSAFPARAQTVTCQVAIDSGIVQGTPGTLTGQSCVYLGVPYAASPAGAGRWRPPAPVVPWTGVKSFVKFGNMCPQIQTIQGVPTPVGNEDCLNLNIFAPNGAAALPVIVFIHGGGNRAASNRAEGPSTDSTSRNMAQPWWL